MSRYTRAARAFEDFTGRRPTKVRRDQLEDHDVVGWEMGPAVGVAYEATRDGEKAQYFHEFAKSARPRLVAREDGKQLFLTGGKYTVTERGIEDMPELFVVNPSSRRAAASKRKPMAAAKRNSKGRFVKGGRAAAPRRRAPRQVAVFQTNPAPKKRRRPRAAAKRSAAPSRRRYRRNPSGRKMMAGLGQLIMPAAGVGAGAVISEMFMGYLPIPAAWKSGVMRQVTKGAVGLGLGWAIMHFLKQKKLGLYVMAGAVAIAVHDGIKEVITARLPGPGGKGAFGQYVLPLPSQFAGGRGHGGMGYVNPALTSRFGQYVDPLASQFGGDSPTFAHPGGETTFVY